MRTLALTAMMIGATLSPSLFAHETENLNYNIVNIQADAARQVANDEMRAVLYIERSNKQPAELSNQINQLMNQAQAISRKYAQVKVETGTQSTYPIYDNDNNKLKEWRARAEIQIESKDFKAASQLISELQQSFQTQSISFTVSDEQRKKVENELMIEASNNFRQRALAITRAWDKAQYNLVSLNLNTSNYFPQPMMRGAMAKFSMAEAAPAQDMAAGESKITVSANGSIQFK
ncbi:SIMPL domain-containing protein [Acinetobacter sp. ANC 4805]|uniref:SIMPL domain-containing protein n=1 Tax=Acinetobacter sp. ANC 4805 TaxID=2923425 RepID=UPI001F4BC38E|nr:SIMPL domain-containing protein [Acinetobacter sp. ANC 4805]MCH7311077.1 SIMPL domain-containing protein [Acinetobacter sp. ANC 4805]